jgi:hypothetical protein
VVVGNGQPWFIEGFREKSQYKGEVYTDPSLASFKAMRLRRDLRSSMGLRVVRNAVQAYRDGYRQTKVQGDPWQQGGVFVIDSDGNICFSYASERAGEHPPTHEIVRALKSMAPAPVDA